MEKHPSKKTREKAYILARNAKKYGMELKTARFSPHHDFISYWFTNGVDYLLVFCTPTGYLAELWQDDNGEVTTTYLGITNIRTLISQLHKLGYKDVDEVLGDVENFDAQDDETKDEI